MGIEGGGERVFIINAFGVKLTTAFQFLPQTLRSLGPLKNERDREHPPWGRNMSYMR